MCLLTINISPSFTKKTENYGNRYRDVALSNEQLALTPTWGEVPPDAQVELARGDGLLNDVHHRLLVVFARLHAINGHDLIPREQLAHVGRAP